MIYLKRFLVCLSFPLAFVLYPFEMGIRYIITGKNSHEETWAYKLVDKYSN